MRDIVQPKSQHEECIELLASLQNDERKVVLYRTLLALTAIGGAVGWGFLVAWRTDFTLKMQRAEDDFRQSCQGDVRNLKICGNPNSPYYDSCDKELLLLAQQLMCDLKVPSSMVGAVLLPFGFTSVFLTALLHPFKSYSLCDRTQALLNLNESPKTNKEAIALLSEKKLELENLHPWTLANPSIETPLLAHQDEDQPRPSLCHKLTGLVGGCCSFFSQRRVQPAADDINLDSNLQYSYQQ